jgi:hypothetical protein
VGQGKSNRNICDIRLDCSSEGNILKNVLIICSGGYESGVCNFLLLAINLIIAAYIHLSLRFVSLKEYEVQTTQTKFLVFGISGTSLNHSISYGFVCVSLNTDRQ